MKILFDQGIPVPLRRELPDHSIHTAYELGWGRLANGELLAAAEKAGFEVLVTTDENIQYQQNLIDRKIAVVALSTTSWPRIKNDTEAIVKALALVTAGTFVKLEIP